MAEIISCEFASGVLRGISEDDAIDFLIGKQINNIEITRKSDRVYIYRDGHINADGNPRTRTLQYIFLRCTKCGAENERSLASVRRSIDKRTLHCTECGRYKAEKDLAGQRYYDLTVLERIGEPKGGFTQWKVRCEKCGLEYVLEQHYIGKTKSCKCDSKKYMDDGREFSKTLFAGGSFVPTASGSRAVNKNSKTGHTGVNILKSKDGTIRYRSLIMFRGKQYYLGVHDTLEEAIRARKAGEAKICGDFLQWYAKTYPDTWEKYTKKHDVPNYRKKEDDDSFSEQQ